jgi:hypothetical protein
LIPFGDRFLKIYNKINTMDVDQRRNVEQLNVERLNVK